jgi:hypothetical protein
MSKPKDEWSDAIASDWSTCEAHVRTAQVGLHAPGIARAALETKR